jgi:transposase-like protein
MPKPYSPEFRRRALDLVASGRAVVEVAELLGIAQSCLVRTPARGGLEGAAGTNVDISSNYSDQKLKGHE